MPLRIMQLNRRTTAALRSIVAACGLLHGAAGGGMSTEVPPTLPDGPPVLAQAAPAARPIRLNIMVHWEGRHLEAFNLEALAEFRRQNPDLRLLHLLSPAYFLKPGANAAATTARLMTVIRPDDGVAVSLGGWKTLTALAGVIHRDGPTFWGGEADPRRCSPDCGGDVPLSVYPVDEVRRMLLAGQEVLALNGFGRPIGMAILGWAASPSLLAAAAEAGFRYDFSGVAPELLAGRAAGFPLYQWSRGLWGAITPHSQPHSVSAGPGTILEMPQSLATLDYVDFADLLAICDEYLQRARTPGDNALVLPLVIAQETAAGSLPLLTALLPELRRRAAERSIPLLTMDLPDLRLPTPEVAVHPGTSEQPGRPALVH